MQELRLTAWLPRFGLPNLAIVRAEDPDIKDDTALVKHAILQLMVETWATITAPGIQCDDPARGVARHNCAVLVQHLNYGGIHKKAAIR